MKVLALGGDGRRGRLARTGATLLALGLALSAEASGTPTVIGPQLGVQLSHSSSIVAVAFSSDGKTVASGSEDGAVKLWNAKDGVLVRTLEGHSDDVRSVAFSPDGKTVATGSHDGTVKLWNAQDGVLLLTLEDWLVASVAFSPDGRTVVSGSADGTMKLWNAQDGALLRTLEGQNEVLSVAFSPDGKTVAAAANTAVELWNVQEGVLLRTLEPHSYVVWSVAFSPDGRTVVSGSSDGTVKLWNAQDGVLVRTLEGHSDRGLSAAFSPDGRTVVSGSADGAVKLWNAQDGVLVRTLEGHSDEVRSVAFSPDGNTVAAGSADGTVKLWNAQDGVLLRTLKGHFSTVLCVAFSPDGMTIAAGSADGTVGLWSDRDGRLLATMAALGERGFATWTPQGHFVANREARKSLHWRVGSTVATLERYEDRFYRPELVARALRGQEPPRDTLAIANARPPSLTWENATKEFATSPAEIQLRYSGSAPLEEVFFAHESRVIDVVLPAKPATDTVLRVPLVLSDRRNRFVAQAWDANRLKSDSLGASFVYAGGRKGPGDVVSGRKRSILGSYGRRRAVVIGIADYKYLPKLEQSKGDLIDLKYADRDATAFVERFLEQEDISGGGWETQVLVGPDATAIAMDEALTKTLLEASPQDLVYIFFSGHGRAHNRRPKDVYLLTYEADPTNQRAGYSYRDLRDLIDDSPARHVVAFIDACRSGTIGFAKGDGPGPFSQDELGSALVEVSGQKVIFASGRGTQSSWEDDEMEQGVFTHYLLEGLRGSAKDSDHLFVHLGELEEYVRDRVLEHTTKNPIMARQEPRAFESDGTLVDDFPLALRRRP